MSKVTDEQGVTYWHLELSNISPLAKIGEGTVIHAGVHIHDEVVIGRNCQIEANALLFNGVTLADNVFIGPAVCFTNDKRPGTERPNWKPVPTRVCYQAKIGAGAMIRAGVTIGERAIVGMGSVVLEDVPNDAIVAGVPAKPIKTKDTPFEVPSVEVK